MALDTLIKALREKPMLGDGGLNPHYVILYKEELRAILEALEAKPKRGRPKVPRETARAS